MQKIQNDADLRAVANQFLTLLKELQSSKQWEKFDDKPLVISRLYNEERVVVRIQTTMNLPFEDVTKVLMDPQIVKKVSDRCLKFEILRQIEGLSVFHTHMKGFAMFSDRQLLAVNTYHRQNDNKIYLGNRSCDFPCKSYEDTVRALTYCAGFIIERVGQNKTHVINIVDMDPSGSIPAFVKNKLATLRASEFAELEGKIKALIK